jgi:hypothetical protein
MDVSAQAGIAAGDYVAGFERCAAEGNTSGADQSEKMINYTRLNWTRYSRIAKHTNWDAYLEPVVAGSAAGQHWVVITEYWCGDAAQNLPYIFRMAEKAGADVQVFFRDAHPDLMDRYLTNGGRSIPKLVVRDAHGNDVFTWGPRPQAMQQVVIDYKNGKGEATYQAMQAALQQMYNRNGGEALRHELLQKLSVNA